MSNFKVGDIVELIERPHMSENHRAWLGKRMTVTGVFTHAGRQACSVDPDWDTRGFYSSALRKIDDGSGYDGTKAGDWDLCPWRPAVAVPRKERA